MIKSRFGIPHTHAWLASWLFASFATLALQPSMVWAEEPSEPTHREVDPIEIDLGKDGKIETMAMDRNGVLLLGISRSSEEDDGREYAIRRASPVGADDSIFIAVDRSVMFLEREGHKVHALHFDRVPRGLVVDREGTLYVRQAKSIVVTRWLRGP